MLKASEFVPVAFEATVVGFNLNASRSKLAARLLDRYSDNVDEITDFGFTRRRQAIDDEFQMGFEGFGFLTVDHVRARVECGFPDDAGPGMGWIPERIKWAVELLSVILNFHKQQPRSLRFDMTWFLWGETSTARLIEHLGLAKSLHGFFATSDEFEIRGDTQRVIPGLFTVDCDLVAGRLFDYEPPENIGVQLRYWSPDNRFEGDAHINYSREVLEQFYTRTPQVMAEQLIALFPEGSK